MFSGLLVWALTRIRHLPGRQGLCVSAPEIYLSVPRQLHGCEEENREAAEAEMENLPLHHIDACVFFELIKEGEDAKTCKRYLNKVGNTYRGKIAIHSFGEVMMGVRLKITDRLLREEASSFIMDLLDSRKIGFYSPQFRAFRIVDEINHLDSRVEVADALHIATAIEEKADVFVTLDENLINNHAIQNKFQLKIRHPSML